MIRRLPDHTVGLRNSWARPAVSRGNPVDELELLGVHLIDERLERGEIFRKEVVGVADLATVVASRAPPLDGRFAWRKPADAPHTTTRFDLGWTFGPNVQLCAGRAS